jgi:hypothetical protein
MRETQVGIRTLSGILEQVAFDGVVVLGHKGGVLTPGCHAQEFLQQADVGLLI